MYKYTVTFHLKQGMCDPGEKVSTTLKREFMEEATNCLDLDDRDRHQIEDHLKEFFESGQEVSLSNLNILHREN